MKREKTIIGILALLLVLGMTSCAVQNKGAGQAALKSPLEKTVTPFVIQAGAEVTEPPGTDETPFAPDKMLEDVVERMEGLRLAAGS